MNAKNVNTVEMKAGSKRPAGKVAPAVAMLLLGKSASAGTVDTDDGVVTIPEPGTLGLMALGAAAGGAVAYARHKRRKK